MPESITIPASIDDAVDALAGIGELIVARKWERSAIVSAFVRLDLGHGGRETDSSVHFESARQFAERGIIGLSSHVSVTKYVQAWLDVHDGKYPRPGATRRLPTGPFPPMRTGTNGYDSEVGAERTVERLIERHGAEPIIEHLARNHPETVSEVIENVPAARLAVSRTRINRVTTERQRRELRERNRQRQERMEGASDEMFTRLEHSGLVDHESTLMARTARLWLRKAVAELERNPLFTDDQRANHDVTLAECEHLLALLRGDTGAWSQTDRDFLDALGIEGEEVSSS